MLHFQDINKVLHSLFSSCLAHKTQSNNPAGPPEFMIRRDVDLQTSPTTSFFFLASQFFFLSGFSVYGLNNRQHVYSDQQESSKGGQSSENTAAGLGNGYEKDDEEPHD
jgi:hypothetical protein